MNTKGELKNMAKNKDSKTVNRSGFFEMDSMTIRFEDKNGINTYDLKSLLQDFDGEEVSLTISSDFQPSYILNTEE